MCGTKLSCVQVLLMSSALLPDGIYGVREAVKSQVTKLVVGRNISYLQEKQWVGEIVGMGQRVTQMAGHCLKEKE